VEDEAGSDREELGQGPEREDPPRPGWALRRWWSLRPVTRTTLSVLAGVAVGAVAVVGVQDMSRHQRPSPSPHPSPVDTLPVSALLVAEGVCTHLQDQVLEVSFRVTNAGQRPVDVVGVRPDLPLGMLLIIRTDLDDGTCGSGPPGPTDGTLAPGQSQPVTFRLLPLESCPQPAPVAAAVDLAHSSPATVSVPVLVDLSSVDFPGCATQAAQP